MIKFTNYNPMQTFNSFQELAAANGTIVPTFGGATNTQPIASTVCATDNMRTGLSTANATNGVDHVGDNGEGGYYKIAKHSHSQWYDSVTDVIEDLEKGWIDTNEALDIARTFGWDNSRVLHEAIDDTVNNSRDGVDHAGNNGEGDYYKISSRSHPRPQWYDSVTDVIADLGKGWISANEAMNIAKTFGWDDNKAFLAAIDAAANIALPVFDTTDNSRDGFDQILPKITEFKRNPRHGEEKAVSGTLTRRVAAAINEIADINDESEQKACAKRLLEATQIVEGGIRHADDAIRASVPNMFDFNPYSDQAKRSMDSKGISYNERKYDESMAMIQAAANRNVSNMKYTEAMAVINDALDAMEQTDNVKNLRNTFTLLATE